MEEVDKGDGRAPMSRLEENLSTKDHFCYHPPKLNWGKAGSHKVPGKPVLQILQHGITVAPGKVVGGDS